MSKSITSLTGALPVNPYAEIILATFIWGTSGAIVKWIDLSAGQLAFFRSAMPTAILLVVFYWQGIKVFKGDYKLMIWASTLNAIRLFFYFTAYNLTSIGNAVILLYTWPIFGTILSYFYLGEPLHKRNIGLLMVAFGGIVLVALNKEISFSDQSFLGMLSMLVSAFIYASTVIIFKKESTRFSRNETLFYQNLVGAVVFLPFLFLENLWPTGAQMTMASLYGIWIGLMAFGLFISALGKIKASTASFLCYFEVLFAILFGIIFFQETLTWNMVFGGMMIIVASAFIKK